MKSRLGFTITPVPMLERKLAGSRFTMFFDGEPCWKDGEEYTRRWMTPGLVDDVCIVLNHRGIQL